MSTKFTNDEWLLIFQQRTQSGLSVRKWCDSNQISYDKYK
ncbi:MAG: IS66 family insertion sequence element accessory protein TnpB, partial [Lachnospiraceae bacterium]|nr:IS66 family insertion sequence element accessory protein TnpB [Lachnospiraceae bacterium]